MALSTEVLEISFEKVSSFGSYTCLMKDESHSQADDEQDGDDVENEN